MNSHRFFPLFAVCALAASALACNIGRSPAGNATQAPAGTQEPVSNPTSQPSASGGACQNPYLPVVAGATWNYTLSGSFASTFTRSILSVEDAGFTDQDVFDKGLTRQGKWTCDHGSLTTLNLPAGTSGNVNADNNNVNADFHTTASSGVTLPASIKPGDTWTQALTLEGIEDLNGLQIPAKNETSNDCTAAGIESVTVPAGTFDALRFDCQTNTDIMITMSGNDIEQTIDFTASNWYAEGVGLIKTVTTGSGLDSTIELVSYTIP